MTESRWHEEGSKPRGYKPESYGCLLGGELGYNYMSANRLVKRGKDSQPAQGKGHEQSVSDRERHLTPRGSVDLTDIQDAELGPAGGAGHRATQPGLWVLLVLAAGKPLPQAGQAPHGPAVALLTLPIASLGIFLAQTKELDACWGLHAADARFQLLGDTQAHAQIDNHLCIHIHR